MAAQSLSAAIGTTLVMLAVACGGGRSTDGSRGPRDRARVLFIGNSLTAGNDVPGLVQALADSAREAPLTVSSVAVGGTALIDHWDGGPARAAIARGGWTVVVLQQGWTPAGVCRDTLRLATRRFAREIERVGARPALFQTWPSADRPEQFEGSIHSYELAASDVGGLLLPAAEAWLAAWARDPSLALYDDGLHASPAGSYLAALAIYARLFERSAVGLPARLQTRSGVLIDLDPAVARTLQEAVDDVTTGRARPHPPQSAPVITSRC